MRLSIYGSGQGATYLPDVDMGWLRFARFDAVESRGCATRRWAPFDRGGAGAAAAAAAAPADGAAAAAWPREARAGVDGGRTSSSCSMTQYPSGKCSGWLWTICLTAIAIDRGHVLESLLRS